MNITEGWAWTEPRVDQLRAMFAAGATAGQIARNFDCGVTRNAVLGKLHRMGLKRDDSRVVRIMRMRQGIASSPRKPRQVRPKPPATPQPPAPRTNPAPVSGSPDARHRCGLLELTNASCRFVVSGDGPPFEFCGAPEADLANGISYCPHHARIVYRRPGEREEAA